MLIVNDDVPFIPVVDRSTSSGRRASKTGKSSKKASNQNLNPETQGLVANNNNNNHDGGQIQPPGEDDDQQSQHPRNKWRCMQPRLCNYCWKTFSNSFNLKQHIVNVHIQSQGVTCSLCSKVVKNKWYLRKHLVTAHGAPLKRVKPDAAGTGVSGKKSGSGSLIPGSANKKPLDMTLATAMALASVNGALQNNNVAHGLVASDEEDD